MNLESSNAETLLFLSHKPCCSSNLYFMLGNQNPILALNFQYEGLDSSNHSFQNQIVERFFSELDLLHQKPYHPLSLLLFVINKFLIISGVLNCLFTKSMCK
jgi:hypothetical protein